MGAWKNAFFLQENHAHKIPRFKGGGVWVLGGGGGGVPIFFLWARGFFCAQLTGSGGLGPPIALYPIASSNRITRDPKPTPKSRNTKKTPRSHELFREVRANFCLLPCEASQELNRNCSEKLVQMNFFILGGSFRVDFPPLNYVFQASHPCRAITPRKPNAPFALYQGGGIAGQAFLRKVLRYSCLATK